MAKKHFDVVVIGSGSGLTISSEAADAGLKVAVVEKGEFGGTCLNRGCIPSKMFIHTADVMETINRAKEFGLTLPKGEVKVNWSAIKKRVWGGIDPDSEGIERGNRKHPNITVFKGEGRFIGMKELRVGNNTISGDKIFICAGGRPRIPKLPGLDKVKYYTSDDVMRIASLPKHMVVVGGGYIASEMAHLFSSLGVKVTMLVRSTMIKTEDKEVADLFTEIVSKKYNVVLGASTKGVAKKGKDIIVSYELDGKKKGVVGDALLLAVGRVPNTGTLDVIKSDVFLDRRGYVQVNEFMESNVPGIYAIGDIAGKYFFKHSANVEAAYASYNALQDKDPVAVNYKAMPHAIFASPQVAGVGKTEEQLKDSGEHYTVGKYYYKDTAMGEAMLEHNGFVKVLINPVNGEILGCHIIGPEASTLIHEVVIPMRAGLTIHTIRRAIIAHPALSEVVQRAFNMV